MDSTEKAFDNAIDLSKQLIALSTGIIAFSVAFFDKEAMMKPSNSTERGILILSWIVLLSSAMVGILWTQRGFISVLKPSTKDNDIAIAQEPAKEGKPIQKEVEPDIRSNKIRYPLNLQSRLFLAGVIAFIIFGIVKVFDGSPDPATVNNQQTHIQNQQIKHAFDSAATSENKNYKLK